MKNSVQNNLPLVSIIIPCRNEEKFITGCLDSILAQDYPKDRLEVLVVDGMSKDRTREIVKNYMHKYPLVRILDNTKKITPCAFNIGIKDAKGEIIMIMSAHATYEKAYISKCAKYLNEYNADNVGGMMVTVPRNNTFIGKAIVTSLSHRFGVGNSAFRTLTKEPTWVDTVFGGCYKKETFDKVGLFNEDVASTEDMEFNQRLRMAGGKILLHPEIISYYYTRSDLRSFCKNNFRNGLWAILPFKISKIVPVSLRHLVPLAFVLSLIGSAVLSFLYPIFLWLFLFIISLYSLTNLYFSSKIAFNKKDFRFLLLMPIMFATLHITYGLGSLWGFVKVVLSGQSWKKGIPFRISMTKRLFDLLLSFGALMLVSPLFLCFAFLIKKEDGGPLFYRGVRVGKYGKPFRILKFRTMVVNADKIGGPSTADDDSRITKVGKFLRRYKLDEIPQLINVLKGEMSFVGPRPEVPFYVNMFTEEEEKILTVRPGITDWASLWNSDEGAILAGSKDPEKTYMEEIRPEKIRLQLRYVREQSFWVDIRIIFLTLLKLIKR